MNACIITMVNGHNKYLREFVDRNVKMGFEKIYISDHNDPSGERPEDVLEGVGTNIVEIKDIREAQTTAKDFFKTNYKMLSYFYEKAGRDGFDFAFVQDPDEFLEGVCDVGKWLDEDRFSKANAICVRWKMYDDNDLLDANGDFRVVDRFTRPMIVNDKNKRLNLFKKCFVRTNVFDFVHEHGVNPGDGVVDVLGNKYSGDPISFNENNLPEYGNESIRLAHYKYMTIGEFCRQKMKMFAKWGGNTLEKFFEVNKDTTQKRNLFNEIMSGRIK